MFQLIRHRCIIGLCVAFALMIGLSSTSYGQSQALNGQIEGYVRDANGGAVPNATINIRNIETGTERNITSDADGSYRAPLLPLGTYRITVEAANFKKLVRDGITLVAGQTATIELGLEAGDVSATVTITSDAPIADSGKIDLGRVINRQEIQDLPLISRNPYNFSLLQANVVGRPNTEFGVPRVSANGYARRTNFQLDGNANTQANQAGLRLVPISETFISEVQLVTNGFSAEFGNTPGLVMNNITPSGTNDIHGSAAYRFRRTSFSSRPFNTSPTAIKAPTVVDNFTGAIGGPIVKDRWHYYGGYEYVTRDFSGRPAQTVTITEANKQALIAAGLNPNIFVSSIPASQEVNFLILRTDAQINQANRLTGRYIRFSNYSPNNIGGGLNTLERTVDLDDKSNSLAIQLATVFSPTLFNEFRYQRASRTSQFLPTASTPTGPSITITNVAQFGPAVNLGTISPIQTMNQFQNNTTWTKGNHQIKFGGGVNRIYDFRRNDISAVYTFPTLASYIAARNGTNLRGYNNFQQTLGNPELQYNSAFYNAFVQDDWRVTPKLKLNIGLRYDLYDVPDANGNAPLLASQAFRVDKNNFAPRLGFVYALRDGKRPTVVRGSFGIYYDTVYLVMYENAIQNNGSGRYLNVARTPTQTGAPDFPNIINQSLASLGITQNVELVNPNFSNMYAMHWQTQIEQALTTNFSVTLGYIRSEGRKLPVYSQINCRPTGATLADGRPLYGLTTVNPTTRAATTTPCTNKVFTEFNNVIEVNSVGSSGYDALTVQLNKRFAQGYSFTFNYTLSQAKDDAPERNLQGVGAATQTDPSNRRRDFGFGIADQRHTVSSTLVARPKFDFGPKALQYLLNNNQFSFIATSGSGETFPITTNFDLNADGILGDLAVGIDRNAGRAGRAFNLDVRMSRVIPLTERFKIELMAEAINIFNINSTVNFIDSALPANNERDSLVNPVTGIVRGPLPTFSRVGQESRQGQFGIKFIF